MSLGLPAAELGTASDAELMARVLGGVAVAGTAWVERLAALPFWERRALDAAALQATYGVDGESAQRLLALWELAERWYPDERPAIAGARDACLLLDGLRRQANEQLVVISVDARRRPLDTTTVALGSLNTSRFVPRDVLSPALRHGAVAVIVGHNHPSGDPSPSAADVAVTAQLRHACTAVGIVLLDHIIVTANSHYSFCDDCGWDRENEKAA